MNTGTIILLVLFVALVFFIIGAASAFNESEKEINEAKQKLFDTKAEITRAEIEKRQADRMSELASIMRAECRCESEKYKKALVTLLRGAKLSYEVESVYADGLCHPYLNIPTYTFEKDRLTVEDYKFIMDVAKDVGVCK